MKFCNACGHGNPEDSSACARCGAPFGQGGDAEGGLGPASALSGGRYEIGRHLGQGGMGSVYQARDLRLDRDVAVKLLKRDLTGHPTARARMEREAKALARLNHPNVVDIYDVLDHEGTLALVIEYVEGGTLSDKLREGAMAWEEALAFMAEVLSGLEALHEAGLVHRDMKPDNVLIDGKRGTPKITDLGVAHDTVGRGMTRQGARLGTPEYMSPEQVQGGAIDGRTDLYACGIVLYEMLVGEVPFVGESEFQVWEAQVRQKPDLERLPGDVPQGLRDVLRRALEKTASDRFESAKAMREALSTPIERPANKARSSHAAEEVVEAQAKRNQERLKAEERKVQEAKRQALLDLERQREDKRKREADRTANLEDKAIEEAKRQKEAEADEVNEAESGEPQRGRGLGYYAKLAAAVLCAVVGTPCFIVGIMMVNDSLLISAGLSVAGTFAWYVMVVLERSANKGLSGDEGT
jgi:serine/threonine protein kinase